MSQFFLVFYPFSQIYLEVPLPQGVILALTSGFNQYALRNPDTDSLTCKFQPAVGIQNVLKMKTFNIFSWIKKASGTT